MQPDSFYHLFFLSSALSLLSLKALSDPPALFLPAPVKTQPLISNWETLPTRTLWTQQTSSTFCPHYGYPIAAVAIAVGVGFLLLVRQAVCSVPPVRRDNASVSNQETNTHVPLYGIFL